MTKLGKHQETWIKHTTKKNSNQKDYHSSDNYLIGDILSHKSFGLGYVQLTFGNKMEVIFEDKVRVLVHKILM